MSDERVAERPLRASAPVAPVAPVAPAPPVALGEARLRALLDGLHIVGAITLHHRSVPRSVATIDHLVVTAAGVWVIDAKPCTGPLTFTADDGEGPDQVVTVQDLSGSALVAKLQDKVDAVAKALGKVGVDEVPVRGAVCFVDAQPVEGQRPLEARGLLFTWSEQLQPELLEPGPFDEEDRAALVRLLERSFTPSR